jgi:hypothetical protein
MSERTSLLTVFFYLIVHNGQFNASLLEHLPCVCIGVITFLADHSLDPCVNDHHRTGPAGCHFTEKRCTLKRNTKPSRLDNRVLLGMKCANAMLSNVTVEINDFAHIMACFVTMRQARGCSDIPRCHNPFVLDNNTPASSSVTGGSPSHSFTEV